VIAVRLKQTLYLSINASASSVVLRLPPAQKSPSGIKSFLVTFLRKKSNMKKIGCRMIIPRSSRKEMLLPALHIMQHLPGACIYISAGSGVHFSFTFFAGLKIIKMPDKIIIFFGFVVIRRDLAV
jgi:hypothetical protein